MVNIDSLLYMLYNIIINEKLRYEGCDYYDCLGGKYGSKRKIIETGRGSNSNWK